jgi:hypothetical protein
VKPRAGGSALLRHPLVGEVRRRYEELAAPGTGGRLLVVFHAQPGSPAADSLAWLSQPACERTGRPVRTSRGAEVDAYAGGGSGGETTGPGH